MSALLAERPDRDPSASGSTQMTEPVDPESGAPIGGVVVQSRNPQLFPVLNDNSVDDIRQEHTFLFLWNSTYSLMTLRRLAKSTLPPVARPPSQSLDPGITTGLTEKERKQSGPKREHRGV